MDEGRLFGRGMAFPPRVGSDGRVSWSEGEQNVREAIQVILLTEWNERLMLPEFGAGLRDFVFEPNTETTRARMQESVRKSLVDWEPRIDVERVEVTADEEAANLVLIHVDYVVRATNSFYNRVFPFYLLEGRA